MQRPAPAGQAKRDRPLASRLSRIGLFAIAAAIPLLTRDQYVLDVLSQAGLFVLLASGLNVVVGLAGLLDLGYIAFWAVGSYTVAFLASPHFGIDLPFLAIVPIALLVTSAFAMVIGVPTLRLRGDYLAIVTLGFGEIVRIALLNGGNITGGPDGLQAIHRPNIFGYQFTFHLQAYYYLILCFCVAGILIGEWLRKSSLGLIWQALRDDELAAKTCGIWPLRNYLLAFGIGAAYGGVSGTLFAAKQIAVSPDSFTVDQSILVLAMVVLGGMSGRFLPVALSALVVVALPEMLRGLEGYRLVVFGPALIAVVIVRSRWSDIRPWLTMRPRWPRRPQAAPVPERPSR